MNVVELLAVERLTDLPPGSDGVRRFRSTRHQQSFYGSIFGGQLLGQSLASAFATVSNRAVHSLHTYFLRPGAAGPPVDYRVETIRDGRAISNRRVTASQGGVEICATSCSFRSAEPGWRHQRTMPTVPAPEDLDDVQMFTRSIDADLPDRIVTHFAGANPIELRPVTGAASLQRQEGTRRLAWLRIPDLGACDDPTIHQTALAWLSDFWMSSAGLAPHRHPLPGSDLLMASLDHALWFHAPARADDWLLFDCDSPVASHGTALVRGDLYDRAGTLVLSAAQEVLQRSRPT